LGKLGEIGSPKEILYFAMEVARVEIHIDDPWYGFISCGRKTVEGKLNKGKASMMRVGHLIDVTSNRGERLTVRIKDVRQYGSFEEYLTQEGLERTLPSVGTMQEALAIYHSYYEPDLDKRLGVLALELVLE